MVNLKVKGGKGEGREGDSILKIINPSSPPLFHHFLTIFLLFPPPPPFFFSPDWPWYARIVFVCQYPDVRAVWKPSPLPSLAERIKDSAKTMCLGVLLLVLGVGCGVAAVWVEGWEDVECWWVVARGGLWGGGIVCLIMFVDCYYCVGLLFLGFVCQSAFVAPFGAVSLSEFWGKRWFVVVVDFIIMIVIMNIMIIDS